jgi:hypothetical protein
LARVRGGGPVGSRHCDAWLVDVLDWSVVAD